MYSTAASASKGHELALPDCIEAEHQQLDLIPMLLGPTRQEPHAALGDPTSGMSSGADLNAARAASGM